MKHYHDGNCCHGERQSNLPKIFGLGIILILSVGIFRLLCGKCKHCGKVQVFGKCPSCKEEATPSKRE